MRKLFMFLFGAVSLLVSYGCAGYVGYDSDYYYPYDYPYGYYDHDHPYGPPYFYEERHEGRGGREMEERHERHEEREEGER